MKSISYAITVCNEYKELLALTDFLLKHKNDHDTIVVLCDTRNASEQVITFLQANIEACTEIFGYFGEFDNDFAAWKNKLNELCTGDFIFQIDADEMPTEALMESLPMILEDNDVDCYAVPRWNIVKGITNEHIAKWGWRVDHKDRINWPDYQLRIYKNVPEIKWEGKVHERPTGYTTITAFPHEIDYLCLHHIKTIEKQEQQNNYYETL